MHLTTTRQPRDLRASMAPPWQQGPENTTPLASQLPSISASATTSSWWKKGQYWGNPLLPGSPHTSRHPKVTTNMGTMGCGPGSTSYPPIRRDRDGFPETSPVCPFHHKLVYINMMRCNYKKARNGTTDYSANPAVGTRVCAPRRKPRDNHPVPLELNIFFLQAQHHTIT